MTLRYKLLMAGGLSVFVFYSAPVRAENLSVTLDEAYRQALEHSPSIQMMKAHEQAAQSMKDQTQTKRLPSLSFNSSVTRGDDPVYVFGSLLRQGRFGPANFATDFLNSPPDLTNYSNSLTAGLPLFTGFELSGRSEMADAGRQWALAGEESARNQIGLAVSESYLDALCEKDFSDFLRKAVQSAESDVNDADRLMKKGLVLGSDYYAARAILEGLKASLIQSEMAALNANVKLKILMGAPVDKNLQVQGSLPNQAPDQNESEASTSSRPDLKMAEAQVQMAQAERKIQGRSFLPDLMAFGSLETNTDDFSKNPSHHMGGVKLDLPLGDPTYFSRKGESEYKLKAAERAYDQSKESAQIEVEVLSNQLMALRSSYPLIVSSRQMAEKSLELFRPLYREGRQSVMEVLRAEDSVVRAHRAELETLANLYKLSLRREAAQGPLSRESIKKLNAALLPGVKP